jgi:hypothetical protein
VARLLLSFPQKLKNPFLPKLLDQITVFSNGATAYLTSNVDSELSQGMTKTTMTKRRLLTMIKTRMSKRLQVSHKL